MYQSLKDLYSILQPEHKRRLAALQFFILCMALAELITVFSILPFMAIITDPSLLQSNELLVRVLTFLQIQDASNLIIYIGMMVISVIFLASLVSIITVWVINISAAKIGFEISSILYRNYMYEPWSFHSTNHSSWLNNKIMNEASRLTSHVLTPLLHINSKLMVILFISTGIIIANPVVALGSLIAFAVIYFLIFAAIKARLSLNGAILTNEQEARIKLIHDGFGGIKDTLILGRQHNFTEKFSHTSQKVAIAGATNQALTQTPRYFLEFFAFSGLIGIVIIFHIINNGNVVAILPTVSLFAVAAFKILPALQILYSSISMIQGNISAVDSIKPDLDKNLYNELSNLSSPSKTDFFHHDITLEGITYSYPSKKDPAVLNINIKLPKNNKIAIVGASGSGKSTLLDIFLCLITADTGKILIDGILLDPSNIREFQNNIGFVPQTPFLSDGSILENISFGLPKDKIDMNAIEDAVKLAQLDDFISSLPLGIDTLVGERGVQISGGQKQRISIARSLYSKPSILVFDEATSALDGNTEADVMHEINNLSSQKTILIVAHRLSTVKKCDKIYFLNDGIVEDSGTYEELFDRNDAFQEMAKKS